MLPPALVTGSIPAGATSVVKALAGVLLPAAIKPVPRSPPPPHAPPPPRSKGGGHVGGFNPTVYYYLGCYTTGTSGYAALPTVLIASSSALTTAACAQAAATANLPYFALKNGNTCVGAPTLAQSTSQGSAGAAACNVPCTGITSQVSRCM